MRDSPAVAPFNEQWAVNALSLLPAVPPEGVTQEYFDLLLHSSLEEMQVDYVAAMKKAIVNYVMM